MTQEQRSFAFGVADSLDYIGDDVRINAKGYYLSPASAPALARDFRDSIVFVWDARMLDNQGYLGCYRIAEQDRLPR